eukprot:2449790-Prymnesium_polylepis.1
MFNFKNFREFGSDFGVYTNISFLRSYSCTEILVHGPRPGFVSLGRRNFLTSLIGTALGTGRYSIKGYGPYGAR